jgi:hypothetical protein
VSSPDVTGRAGARREALIVGSVATLLCVLQCVAFHGLRHDDAFIVLRYAQNLALGRGMVFNPGERLMGSTSPGQALLGAPLYLVFSRDLLPSVMAVLGCLGWTAQALGIAWLLHPALGRAAYAPAGLVALGAAWAHRYVTLETDLVAALVVWAMALAVHRRWWGAMLTAAAAVWMRPDAAILALPLGVLAWLDLGPRAMGPALAGVLAVAPWPLFAWVYFGSVIPQSAHAKVGSVPFGHTRTCSWTSWADRSWPRR